MRRMLSSLIGTAATRRFPTVAEVGEQAGGAQRDDRADRDRDVGRGPKLVLQSSLHSWVHGSGVRLQAGGR